MTGTLRWHSCSTTDFPLKRHKVSKACEACRNKKMRCDGKHPCQRCENNKMECKYNDRPIRSRTLKPLCIETNLDKITLTNEIHETFRLSRPHHGTCLSPLLFDFFHLTSQPAHIWRLWTEYHQNLRASASSIEWMMSKNQLVKEAFKLFVTHNLLYGTLIHSQMLAFVLQSDSVYAYLPSRPQHHSLISPRPSLTHPPSNDYDAVVIYSVLALVFSSLPEEHENLMEDAMTLYKKAHALFIQLCFPATFSDPAATVPNQKEIEWMVLASILLAHFQCAVIHPEQAYLTIRLGQTLVQQSAFTLKDDLLRIMDAWYIWLTFYLNKPYSPNELLSQQQPKEDKTKKTKEQQWAICVTENYSQFLKSLLTKQHTNIQTIKESLASLSNASQPQFSFECMRYNKNPCQIISVYHHVLTVQILTRSLDLSVPLSDETKAAVDTCTQSLQQMLKMIAQVITYCSNNQIIGLPFSITYAVCSIAKFVILCLGHKELEQVHKLHTRLTQLLKSTYVDTFDTVLDQLNHPTRTIKKRNRQPKTAQMPLSPSSSSSSDLTATIQKNNKLCDAADMIIPHTETSGAMSQFLSQPTIPNELLVADNMRTFDPMAPTNIHSRADIDREQLEKLSHKPNRTYEDMLLQQKPMASFDVTNNQQDMFSRYVSPTTTFAMHTHKKSHPYHPLLQQHDMVHYYYSQHKRPYHSMEYVSPYKKSKSNASQHETSYMHQDLVSSPQQQRSRQSSMTGPFVDVNELASESQSTNDAALMYWVLDGSEEAAFYQVGTPPNNDDKQQPSPAHPTEFNPSVSLSTWPAAMEAENGTVTKLPLPQPSKPTSMPLKNWSAPTQTRTWSKFFFASEMQTLHYQTPPLIHFNEPSSSLSMGLNMMPEEEEEETKEGGLFYPYHKGIKNTKEMVMMPSQQQEQSDTSQVASKAAAAAAAAAIWAAATADTNKPEKKKKTIQDQLKETDQWMPPDKVGGDENYIL